MTQDTSGNDADWAMLQQAMQAVEADSQWYPPPQQGPGRLGPGLTQHHLARHHHQYQVSHEDMARQQLKADVQHKMMGVSQSAATNHSPQPHMNGETAIMGALSGMKCSLGNPR